MESTFKIFRLVLMIPLFWGKQLVVKSIDIVQSKFDYFYKKTLVL